MSPFSIFRRNFFCLPVPKKFVGEPSVLYSTKFSVVKKLMDERAGEYQDFPSKIFCLKVPRNFVGKPFSVSLLSGAKEVCTREGRGSIKIFCRKLSFPQCRNFS